MLPSLSKKTFTAQLREMEREGVITRKVGYIDLIPTDTFILFH